MAENVERVLEEHEEGFDRKYFTATDAQRAYDPLVEYEFLSQYTTPVKRMERPVVGRDAEMRSILAAFERPELCNVILLGDAGAGKTAVVQGLTLKDSDRRYLEVSLSKMISDAGDNPNKMAEMLKQLFSEAARYTDEQEQQIVLFIDEFHQIVQLSAAAVEALKPLLADSGTRGIRVIAATTYIEFQEFVAPNQPLVERLMRINLRPPTKEMVVEILKGMAERYEVAGEIYDDSVYELIFEYSERYVPANSQPRKSLLILDAMVGWHRSEARRIDAKLLADVLYDTEGVNVAFRVDASSIKSELDKHVLAQDFATTAIEKRLQVCIADLNDKTKPMSSLLFTGSTGTGKTEVTKQLARILFHDPRNLIRLDMTEYANPDSLDRFRNELTARVWERPFSIVMLDEIEKACSPVTRVLLQVLDDGRLTDRHNREVSFLNAYIIMTTNAGSELYKTIAQYNSSDTGAGEMFSELEVTIRRSLQALGENKFPPELIGRLDAIVPFQPLSENTMRRIAEMKLQDLRDQVLSNHGVKLKISRKVTEYLVFDNMTTESDAGGAREVVSKLEREVTTAVAKFINENPMQRVVGVTVEGTMAADDKTRLKSDAHIRVAPTR